MSIHGDPDNGDKWNTSSSHRRRSVDQASFLGYFDKMKHMVMEKINSQVGIQLQCLFPQTKMKVKGQAKVDHGQTGQLGQSRIVKQRIKPKGHKQENQESNKIIRL